MITISLSKSVQAHGATISELELQDPSLEQIQQFGLPVSMDSSGNFTVNVPVAIRYVPVLSGLPPSSLKNLSPFDVNSLCWAVWRFFMIPQTTDAEMATE